jgi:hypothetical protein
MESDFYWFKEKEKYCKEKTEKSIKVVEALSKESQLEPLAFSCGFPTSWF